MASDVKISYINLPVTFDQALDGIAYDHGEQGLGKALRLLCACASQQSKHPEYMLDITGEKGWKLLAGRLRFDSVKDCMDFISDMRAEGLCAIVAEDGREYVACPIVSACVDAYKGKSERAKNAAKARWSKKNELEGGESE